MTARDHWRQVQRETAERRHDRARLLIAEAEGQEAVKMYHSTPCITGRHRECGDAACTCRCGHQGRLLPVKMKDDPAAKSSAATAAVLNLGITVPKLIFAEKSSAKQKANADRIAAVAKDAGNGR